jgi:hypothetical protein
MKIVPVALLTVASLAFAACGDDDDDDSAPTTAPAATEAPATAAPTTATPATTEPAVSDAELARSALLTIDDMPTGWTETAQDPGEDAQDAATIERISDCSGLDADLIGDGVLGDTEAKSPDFDSPDELASVTHSVGLAPDEDTAVAAVAAIGDDALAPCYEEAMRASFAEAATTTDPSATLAEGVTLSDITMERIDPPVEVTADEAVWYEAAASLDYQGQTIDIYLNLLFTRTGRVLSQLEFDGTTAAFPQELFEPTISAAQAKVDAIANA